MFNKKQLSYENINQNKLQNIPKKKKTSDKTKYIKNWEFKKNCIKE